jgi:DNA polymerase I-like protein with 3'-5' exonuclease and polymerase domains
VRLPDVSGLTVAFDTEGSGLFTDDGARVSAASCAWRDPRTGLIASFSTPFDQGLHGQRGDPSANLPCALKHLTRSHDRRIGKWDDGMKWAPNRPMSAWDHLMRWLLRQRLVMQNAKYDCLMVLAGLRNHIDDAGLGYDLMPALLWDTMLASGVLWPGETTSLKPTAVRLHVGAEAGIEEGAEAREAEDLAPWKGPQADPRYDLIPWSVLGSYSELDAILTLLLYEHQQRELEENSSKSGALARSHIAEELRLQATLYGMERRGVGLDGDGMRHEDAKLAGLVSEAEKSIPFRATYPGAQKYFFGAPADGGLGLLRFNDKVTKSGNPQVDEEVIERLVKQEVPGAREFAHFAELKAAREKWYSAWPAMVGGDGRIRTCHRQGRVVSGRLSVERWQAQAMPHDYQIPDGILPPRFFLVPAYGCETWEADASQAEIRVATAVAKCTPMLRALRAGTDSHDAATHLMFYQGYSLDEAKADRKWNERRQVAKRCNLGILYGIGVKGLQKTIAKFTGIVYDQDQVSEWISDWKQAFPQFADALYEYQELAQRQGFVRLATGRVRMFSPYEPVHKAFNQRVQGDVAEAAKRAMIRFDRDYPGMLLLQIHDSLAAEIPRERVEEVTQAMQKILVETFEQLFRPVPFRADVKPFGRGAYDG